jgi:hypothetical protein
MIPPWISVEEANIEKHYPCLDQRGLCGERIGNAIERANAYAYEMVSGLLVAFQRLRPVQIVADALMSCADVRGAATTTG